MTHTGNVAGAKSRPYFFFVPSKSRWNGSIVKRQVREQLHLTKRARRFKGSA